MGLLKSLNIWIFTQKEKTACNWGDQVETQSSFFQNSNLKSGVKIFDNNFTDTFSVHGIFTRSDSY